MICKLFCHSNSSSISSSSIRDTKLVNNLLGIAKLHSENISTFSFITYSIAISKLFEINTIFQKFTLNNIVSRIGVVVIFATAWLTILNHSFRVLALILNFIDTLI